MHRPSGSSRSSHFVQIFGRAIGGRLSAETLPADAENSRPDRGQYDIRDFVARPEVSLTVIETDIKTIMKNATLIRKGAKTSFSFAREGDESAVMCMRVGTTIRLFCSFSDKTKTTSQWLGSLAEQIVLRK